MEKNRKKILLLTLIHPDFLPPVYAAAQVLRDVGFDIHILTFDSFVPAKLDIGSHIELESVGRHFDASIIKRLTFRREFIRRARKHVHEEPVVIISFCPFSFLCGLKVKKSIPLIYIALEIADFKLPHLFHSFLSNIRNLQTLRKVKHADLVATPSVQRSAWLAGRCHLKFMPYTILNTAYLPKAAPDDNYETFKEIITPELLGKKIVLYTGAVNADLCVMELVKAFEMINDPDSALVITGMKDTDYCHDLENVIAGCRSRSRIKTFPYLTRSQMISLQTNAHIGVCLVREFQNDVKSKMMAPNKVGEYLSKNLYILGVMTEYLKPFQTKGLASLADSCTPRDVSRALTEALGAVRKENYREKIASFVKNEFCMQKQLLPVTKYINELINVD